MSDISRRIKNAEKKLNLNEKLITITIVVFGGELLPDETVGNLTYRYVMYDEKANQ